MVLVTIAQRRTHSMAVSLSRSIECLLKDIHFDKEYDNDLQQYIEALKPYAKTKDWNGLSEALIHFLTYASKHGDGQKLFIFNRYMQNASIQDRLTEEQYMAMDDSGVQQWVDMLNGSPDNKRKYTVDDYVPTSEEKLLKKGLPQRYAHYNWDYLYRVAKERKCSIDTLERIQGLVPYYVIGGKCSNDN